MKSEAVVVAAAVMVRMLPVNDSTVVRTEMVRVVSTLKLLYEFRKQYAQ